jgi:hypothetical protein
MTAGERVAAVAEQGFTMRQAGFLVAVMLHAGVFVGRQYCAYSRTRRGQKLQDFVARLRTRRLATAYPSAHRRAWIYHLHAKPLYQAVGEPDNRHRKPTTLARAIERLMLLDAVIGDPETRWLGTESEKREHFTCATTLRPHELPRLVFGVGPAVTVRYFADKLPIGIASDHRTHIFLYPVTRDVPTDLRVFIYRHAELLRALPQWEVRLLVPRHLRAVLGAFEAAAREELANPLRPDDIRDLRWFFEEKRRAEAGETLQDATRLNRLRAAFRQPRFWALYRYWCQNGDAIVFALSSPVLREALARRSGRLSSYVLSHTYQHLAPLTGSS